jgi:hypothetical protein
LIILRCSAQALVSLMLAGTNTGCGLSEYERPQAATVSSDSLSSHDVITYRQLSLADFLADQPPPAIRPHQNRFWAYSCLQLRPRDNAPLTITRIDHDDAAPRYIVAPKDLHYQANFDRDCSWWNRSANASQPYVLQHEQIHFLITELEARRMNRHVAEIIEQVTSVAATPQDAAASTQQKLKQVMEAAVQEMRAQHLAFDKDASEGMHAEQQARWWQRLSAELAADDAALP